NIVPGAQTVNEDAVLAIAGVSVSDADGNLATTQLSVTNGVLNVSLAGGATDSDTVAITVNPVNDGPLNTVPGAQTVNEDTPLPIAGLSVNDVDGNLASTQLSVGNGVLNVSLAGGASISAGANGSSTLTLSGTQAQINAALASLNYQANADFNGADTLAVLSTDANGATDSDTVAISVTSVNDGPVNTVPGAQSVAEDALLSIGG